MALESSGTSLSASYYLRNFYAFNREAIKVSTRSNYSTGELSYEDSRALHRAAKALDKFSFDENENSDNIKSSIKALIDTYNNSLDSTEKNTSSDMKRYASRLKSLTKKYSDELEEIGVSIKSNGKLSYNDNLLKSADIDKVKEVFGKDSGFTKQLKQISKGLNGVSLNEIYSDLTGKGQSINITL